jgi:hypothetical protein
VPKFANFVALSMTCFFSKKEAGRSGWRCGGTA